jgi:hypothetical protein
MPTVFISNVARDKDYTPAAKYGAIRGITRGNYPIYKTNRLIEEIIEPLLESKPDDFLVLSGSSVICALCVAIWFQIHDDLKVLLHDRSNNSYIERHLKRSELRLRIEQISDQLRKRGVVRRDT